MKLIKSEKQANSLVELQFSVDAETFKAAVDKAFKRECKKYNVPGFRRGKAPRAMIEKMFGADVFHYPAINDLFPEAYEAAVAEAGLQVVGQPMPEVVSESLEEGFVIKAMVPVQPEITLGDYAGLEVTKTVHTVTDADVAAELERMQQRNGRQVTREGAAVMGDTATIDFEGFLGENAFEGGKGEKYPLELGSGAFIPGFEDQVIGHAAGDEFDVNVKFPEEYQEDLAGKDATFKVKIHEITYKELPELDDEFAKDVSEFETLKELKDDTKAKITAEREQSAKIAFENALLEKVAGDIKADIPEVMIEEQCRRFLDEFKQRLQAQGIPYDQYCKMTGMDEAKFMEDGREPAVRQVKMDLAIAAIIKAENLDVTDEEIEEKYKSMAEQYGMELDMLKKYLDAPTVRNQLLNEKAIAVVVDSAKAEKPAKAEKTEGEEEKKPAKKTAKKAAEGEEEKKPAAKKTTKKAAEGEEEKKPAKKTAKKAAEKAE